MFKINKSNTEVMMSLGSLIASIDAIPWDEEDEIAVINVGNGVPIIYSSYFIQKHLIISEVISGKAVTLTYCSIGKSLVGYMGEWVASGISYSGNLVLYQAKSYRLYLSGNISL